LSVPSKGHQQPPRVAEGLLIVFLGGGGPPEGLTLGPAVVTSAEWLLAAVGLVRGS
jgi:hypothetical protein